MRETRKSEKARRVPVPVRLLVPFVLVVLLAAAGNLLLCHLLVPSGRIGQAVEKLEREDHETLELGLSPETAGLHMREYYYLLQDVCRRHAPKELVLQYDPSVWTADDPADRESRVLLREMAFSKVKLSYARELFAGRHVRYLLFPWLWYLGGGAANEAAPAHCRTLEDSAGYEAQQAWFEKIVRYCREKNIVLTMVTVPEKRSVVLDNVDFYYEADRRMTALADESGFGYLDYLLSPSSGVSLDDSLFDSENGRLTKTAEADFRQTLSADLAAAAGRAPAVESRLGRVPDLMPEDGTWKVTQFGEARGKQEMFYAVTTNWMPNPP